MKIGIVPSFYLKRIAIGFFTYLFAKSDRENISKDELKAFKKLAKDYSLYLDKDIKAALANNDLLEICDDCTKKI